MHAGGSRWVGHRLNHPSIRDILLLSCWAFREVAKAVGELPEGWTVQRIG